MKLYQGKKERREIKETTVGGAFIKSNFIPTSFCWVFAEVVAVGQHLGNRLYFSSVNFTHTSSFSWLPFLLRERLGCLHNKGDPFYYITKQRALVTQQQHNATLYPSTGFYICLEVANWQRAVFLLIVSFICDVASNPAVLTTFICLRYRGTLVRLEMQQPCNTDGDIQ